jgi:hypothetical protein
VIDGQSHADDVTALLRDDDIGTDPRLVVCVLPINVGSNWMYGHRVYAAFTHLVNTKFVVYLDEDNWFLPTHIHACLEACGDEYDWVYSLRNIYVNDTFLCKDDCESVGMWPSIYGYNLVDTNTYFLRTSIAIKVASSFHGGWGQDRIMYTALSRGFPKFVCTGKYTVNYSAKEKLTDFFLIGNEQTNGNTPWRK